jgi:hypothetical protein
MRASGALRDWRLDLVRSGRLPADAETLALTQERKRAQRERDLTPRPIDEGPRATLLPVGLVEPVNARCAARFTSNAGWPATLAYGWKYVMTLQRVNESGNPL